MRWRKSLKIIISQKREPRRILDQLKSMNISNNNLSRIMAVYVLACMWPQIQFLAHIKMQIALILKYRIPGLVNPTGIG
jgi:hypothetical protein